MPQFEPLKNAEGQMRTRKPTPEEMMQAVRELQEAFALHMPADWDLDAELEAEHAAVLAGHDI